MSFDRNDLARFRTLFECESNASNDKRLGHVTGSIEYATLSNGLSEIFNILETFPPRNYSSESESEKKRVSRYIFQSKLERTAFYGETTVGYQTTSVCCAVRFRLFAIANALFYVYVCA